MVSVLCWKHWGQKECTTGALQGWWGWEIGDGCGMKFRYPVHTAHISMTESELRRELAASSTQLLVRIMRTVGTVPYLYCMVVPSRHLINTDELFSKSGAHFSDVSHITVTWMTVKFPSPPTRCCWLLTAAAELMLVKILQGCLMPVSWPNRAHGSSVLSAAQWESMSDYIFGEVGAMSQFLLPTTAPSSATISPQPRHPWRRTNTLSYTVGPQTSAAPLQGYLLFNFLFILLPKPLSKMKTYQKEVIF